MEEKKDISFVEAVEITKKLLCDIELPVTSEKPAAIIRAAIKNLEIIAAEMRKREAENEKPDDQAEIL